MTPRAERKDTGRYTLRLKNDSGVVKADINVTVLGACVTLRPLCVKANCATMAMACVHHVLVHCCGCIVSIFTS